MKKAIAMRCTKEQFEAIEPKLIKEGIKLNVHSGFKTFSYLTSPYERISYYVGNYQWPDKNREVFETWNEKVFLEACGISTIPTLEEVKEYFKDAEKVKCLFNGTTHDITKGKIFSDMPEKYCAEPTNTGSYCRLYKDGKFAEILTTKQKTYTLTEDQLRSLTDPAVKKMFPEVFPETVLEVGKWYSDGEKFLYCPQEIKNANAIKAYGFDIKGIYSNADGFIWGTPKNLKEATEAEVQKAITAESEKRGFVKGAFYKCLESGKIFQVTSQEVYKSEGNERIIFSNGIWAEVVTLEKWKYYTDGKGWFCFDGNFDQDGSVCGFGVTALGDWKKANSIGWGHGGLIEMSEDQKGSALKIEAIKKGYNPGVWFKDVHTKEVYKINSVSYYEDSNDLRSDFCIFSNGIWAEIIPSFTKSEAEAKFNIKIKD